LLLTRGREQPQGDGSWRKDLGRLGDWTTSSLVPDGSRVLVAPAARWSGRRLIAEISPAHVRGETEVRPHRQLTSGTAASRSVRIFAAKLPTQEKACDTRGAPSSSNSIGTILVSPSNVALVVTLVQRWR